MRRGAALLVVTCALAPAVPGAAPVAAAGPDVVIAELMASNTNSLILPDGSAPDWVELWNRGDAAADLGGWRLRDSGVTPFVFPVGTVLAADDRLLVYADDATSTTPGLHAPFKLSSGGEYLGLADATNTVASEFLPAYPAQTSNIAYGIGDDGTTMGFLLSPTPGAANTAAAAGSCAKPTISVKGGWFTDEFQVTLATATAGAAIRYTTDGSTPTAASGTPYTGPIEISATTVLRAVATKATFFDSHTVAATYLLMADVLAQDATAPLGWPSAPVNGQVFDYGLDQSMVAANREAVESAMSATPTLSIVTDQADLTDASRGIYTNPARSGSEWERSASIELIDGAAGFQINGGLRIKGGYSRTPDNPKHSFRLKFGTEHDGLLQYDVFGSKLNGVTTDVFTELDLRAEQNGSWHEGSSGETMLRDVWLRDSQAAIGDPSTRSRWVHLFLNGQYWGLYMLKDRPTAGYAAQRWGGATTDYDVIKHADDYGFEVQDGDDAEWRLVWRAIADQVITDGEYATITSLVDLPNLADFMLLNMGAGNRDSAPADILENSRANNWYAIAGNGQPFRFFTDDGEQTLGLFAGDPTIDTTGPYPIGAANQYWRAHFLNPGWLHEVLLGRAEYRTLLRERVVAMFTGTGAMTQAQGLARWQVRQAEVDPLVIAEAARWGDAGGTAYDRQSWVNAVAWVVATWFPARTAVMLDQFEAHGWWVSSTGIADAGYAPAQRLEASTP